MRNLIKTILGEQFYSDDDRGYVEKYSSAYNDFGDQKFLKHILNELDNSIVIEDVVPSLSSETDWTTYIDETPFDEHQCYGCTGVYHYPNIGDLNLSSDFEDNDQIVSAISIMLEDIFGGDDWMEYYYIVHKYLQDRIYKYMKERNYPDKHDMEW